MVRGHHCPKAKPGQDLEKPTQSLGVRSKEEVCRVVGAQKWGLQGRPGEAFRQQTWLSPEARARKQTSGGRQAVDRIEVSACFKEELLHPSSPKV